MRSERVVLFCMMHGPKRAKADKCPDCSMPGEWVLSKAQASQLGRLLSVVVDAPDLLDLHVRKDGTMDVLDLVAEVRKRSARYDYLQPIHIKMMVETDPHGRYELCGCHLGRAVRAGGEK